MPAIAQGVQRIRSVMQELKTLESTLRYEDALQELKDNIHDIIYSKQTHYEFEELDVPSVLLDTMEPESDEDMDSDESIDWGQKRMDFVKETLKTMLNYDYGKSAKQVELKASINKLLTAPEFLKCLNNLEVQGEPVGGLSSEEREMVVLAREKVNKLDCDSD
jgi:hypothetical protein